MIKKCLSLLKFNHSIHFRFGASIPTFKAYNIQNKSILEALAHNNIHTPSPIQDLVIPSLLNSLTNSTQNIFYIAAQNGTGKTLSYLLPIIDVLKTQESKFQGVLTIPQRPRSIIFVPNKELAQQLEEEGKKISHFAKLIIYSLSNSKKYSQEKEKLLAGVDILITTIERFERHRKNNSVFISNSCFLVVDEADTFFDSGFGEVIQSYIKSMQVKQQEKEIQQQFVPKIILVSATYTGQLNRFFRQFDQTKVKKLTDSQIHQNLENLKHEFIHCKSYDKQEPLLKLLREILGSLEHKREDEDGGILIFCNSIPAVQSLQYILSQNNIQCVPLHGDVPKKLRIQNYQQFKKRVVKIMICTDLGSRGLNFPFLTHVINFDFPCGASDYLHRAGRAGRAGKKGFVFSLYRNKDLTLINQLQKSYDSDSPLLIANSQYQMINKEILKKMAKQDPKMEISYKQQKKQYIQDIHSYKQFLPIVQKNKEHKDIQQNKTQSQLLKKFKPQVDQYTRRFKAIQQKLKRMKKWQKVKQMSRVRQMNLDMKKNKRGSYYYKKSQEKLKRRRQVSFQKNQEKFQ